LGWTELFAQSHEARHFVLGQAHLVAAELGETEIANLEFEGGG
jgi:hypothetical protein